MTKLITKFIALTLLLICFLPIIITGFYIKLVSNGPIIYWSKRVGKNNKIFLMPKLRTMEVGTSAIATHLMDNPNKYLIKNGHFIRRLSIDELPQLFSIIKGDINFIGPRPALYNEKDLIEGRKKRGIDKIKPGITGWAQVNGRDNISIRKKIELDHFYLKNMSSKLDLIIIIKTFLNVVSQKDVKH